MNYELAGRAAVVTRGRGIGRAISRLVLKHGTSVVIAAINENLFVDTAAEVAA